MKLLEGFKRTLETIEIFRMAIADHLNVFIDQLLASANVAFFCAIFFELLEFNFGIFLTQLDFFFALLDHQVAVFEIFFLEIWQLNMATVFVDCANQPSSKINNFFKLLSLDFFARL